MECNKDEALRAKKIAESKLQVGDFVGALKFAVKAQKLFPEVENIVHILTVCEVHCAAQNKLFGSEMDWYGILQAEKFADEATIKKQYRKLALLLHPDKNKFSGAEAAFKLIGEANRVLNDQAKRSSYDMKCRSFTRTAAPKPPSHHSNVNVFSKKHDVHVRNYQNNSQSTSWSSHQQAALQTFWTSCNHCNTWYQYYKSVLNATLRCQHCSRSFIAHDLGFHDGPPGSYKWASFNNQREYPKSESMTKCTAGVGENCKVERSKDGNVAPGSAKVDVRTSKPVSSKAREPQTSTYVGSKRPRQSIPDSRESCKTENGNGVEDTNIRGSGVDPSGLNAGVKPRRSSREKQHVSYSESCHDDVFESPSKRARQNGSSSTIEVEKREVPASVGVNSSASSAARGVQSGGERNKANGPPKEIFAKKSKNEQSNVHRMEPSKSGLDDTSSKADYSSPLNSSVPSSPEIISCPDPDFCDFEKNRAENCFATDQFWAIYDPRDSMPRFYARVKKVLSPGFKVLITWLEPDPDKEGEIDWDDAELPVGCGKFVVGESQKTEDLGMFSHQVHCIKKSGRSHYMVYPCKGETWAIFRDWDIGWSSNPEKYSKYEFQYVEVLSDFAENVGVEVVYLCKVKGFVSLFQRSEHNGVSLFCVPPNELYRFSHRIPSFKMTGDEREGVPPGSFELDPAGLPVDLFEVGDTGDVKMDDGMLNTGVKSPCQESSERKAKHVMANESSHEAKVQGNNDVKRASSILRRSPRGSNRKDMDNGQVNKSQNMTSEDGSKDGGHKDLPQPEGTDESSDLANDVERASSILRRSPRGPNRKNMENGEVNKSQYMTREDGRKAGFSQPEGTTAASQADEKVKTPKKPEKSDCEREGLNVRRSPRDLSKKKARVDAGQCANGEVSGEHSDANKNSCYDFSMGKSKEKFERDQIWALYGDGDQMPGTYAVIKKIEVAPKFRLHVAFLEPCSPPKAIAGAIACGTFMVKNAKTQILSRSAFSHQLQVEPVAGNRYEIYPRKGEIWALFKAQNYESTCSNHGRGDCQIVEVLADNDKSIKVLVLVRQSDTKPIYKAPRVQRSKTGVIEIPRGDAYRFSHQIPAIWHNGEDNIDLRGCWELDPSSIPVLYAEDWSVQRRLAWYLYNKSDMRIRNSVVLGRISWKWRCCRSSCFE
ncbi:DnaJ like subfamily B member 14 [Senna tora]|uniref:DnaJ like subfamily B member 14 n=1 Tax=Senna tora TaxID=362788 RepID=A0A834W0Y1_9FABA|nr:DnaJ like subfamily B member 14 [Senna tora]